MDYPVFLYIKKLVKNNLKGGFEEAHQDPSAGGARRKFSISIIVFIGTAYHVTYHVTPRPLAASLSRPCHL